MTDITSALSTGLTAISVNLMAIAVIVIPVALTIWGALLGIKYAKKFFGAVAK